MNAFINIINKAPFLRLLLPLIAGIILQYYVERDWLFIPFLVFACICFGFSLISFSSANAYRFRWLFGVGAIAFFTAIGAYTFTRQSKQHVWPASDTERFYICQITDSPVEKPNTTFCRLHVYSYVTPEKSIPVDRNIVAYIHKDSLSEKLIPGDCILMKASVAPVKNSGNPEEFDYASFLKQQGFSASAFIKQSNWKIIEYSTGISLKHKALHYRSRLLSIYNNLDFSDDERALLSALTLGYQDDLSPELKAGYSETGVSHILSVSGLHVGIIYMFMTFLLFPLGKNKVGYRIMRQCIIIICIWIFAFITGLSPPVVRASVMISLVSLAVMLNRRSSILNAICISGFGMLLYNPYYLFDVSFQLSYAAMFSIVLFQPFLENLFNVKNRLLKPVWSLVTVSVAAQLGTFPFAIYYFHHFPCYFIGTNLLIIPATYIATGSAVLLLFTQTIFGTDLIVKEVLRYSLKAMNESVTFIQQLPGASIHDIWYYKADVLLILVLTGCFFMFIRNRKASALIGSLICIIGLFMSYNIKVYQSESMSGIIFLQQTKSPAVNLIANHNNYLLTDNVEKVEYETMNFRMKYQLPKPVSIPAEFSNRFLFRKDDFTVFNGKTIYLLKSNDLLRYRSEKKLPVDYLVIGKGFTSDMRQLTQFFSPKHVILDASLPEYISRRLKKECDNDRIDYHDIREKGALICRL